MEGFGTSNHKWGVFIEEYSYQYISVTSEFNTIELFSLKNGNPYCRLLRNPNPRKEKLQGLSVSKYILARQGITIVLTVY